MAYLACRVNRNQIMGIGRPVAGLALDRDVAAHHLTEANSTEKRLARVLLHRHAFRPGCAPNPFALHASRFAIDCLKKSQPSHPARLSNKLKFQRSAAANT